MTNVTPEIVLLVEKSDVMNRIKQLREEKNMTQIRLSTELEVTQETVSSYENGKHYPSVQNLLKLSEIFNASCDYILGLSEVRNVMHNNLDTAEEAAFKSLYRALYPQERELAKAYMQGLIDNH